MQDRQDRAPGSQRASLGRRGAEEGDWQGAGRFEEIKGLCEHKDMGLEREH